MKYSHVYWPVEHSQCVLKEIDSLSEQVARGQLRNVKDGSELGSVLRRIDRLQSNHLEDIPLALQDAYGLETAVVREELVEPFLLPFRDHLGRLQAIIQLLATTAQPGATLGKEATDTLLNHLRDLYNGFMPLDGEFIRISSSAPHVEGPVDVYVTTRLREHLDSYTPTATAPTTADEQLGGTGG